MNVKRLKTYWLLWSKMATYAVQEAFLNRATNALFLFGKMIRLGMLLTFLYMLKINLQGFGGYTIDQVIIFFLTYQLTDTMAQIVYRGVYTFSWQVRSGELDFYLSKPINPLFRILTGKPDILDVIFMFPSTLLSIWIATHLQIHFTIGSVLLFITLLMNSFLIITAFHILVVCLGILTTEVDNTIMLYRDFTGLSRFPVEIYKEPLRTILFFLVPVGFMNTVPAQVIMNAPLSYTVGVAFAVGVSFFLFSIWAWQTSLKKYTSAGG